MSKRLLGLAALGLAVVGLCGACPWALRERPRFSHEFDIGGGRTLRVWSIRPDEWFEKNPLMVYYRIDAGDREVVPPTFLDHDDGGAYEFRVATADGGRLACVYEVTRRDNPFLFLVYDTATGQSWPREWNEQGGTFEQVAAGWRDRTRRLRDANPELQAPALMADDP